MLIFPLADGSERQAYDKRCPFALAGAFRANRPAMKPHELFHNGKSKTEPTMMSRKRRISLPETVKNVSEKLGFDTQPRVFYRNFEM